MTIASEITRLQTAKSNIVASIGRKGVTVPASAKYDNMSAYIDMISTGGGDDIISYMRGILSIKSPLYHINKSDDVRDRFTTAYSYKDGSYLYLIKAYNYEDYSSSGHSYNTITFRLYALQKGGTSLIQSVLENDTGWYRDTYIDYYGFYKEGSTTHFKFYLETYEYSDRKDYWCADISFSNGAWSSSVTSWDGTTPSRTGGNMGLFSATFEGSLSGESDFLINWKPV